jgi:hypothetical protein
MALGSWYHHAAQRLVRTVLNSSGAFVDAMALGHEALVSVSGSVCVALRFGL